MLEERPARFQMPLPAVGVRAAPGLTAAPVPRHAQYAGSHPAGCAARRSAFDPTETDHGSNRRLPETHLAARSVHSAQIRECAQTFSRLLETGGAEVSGRYRGGGIGRFPLLAHATALHLGYRTRHSAAVLFVL